MTRLHSEPIVKMYVRIRDTYEYGDEVHCGIAYAKTQVGTEKGIVPYYLITLPNGTEEIHPCYACTEITEKEYFLGVLKG